MTDLAQAIDTFAKLKQDGCDFEKEDWTESDTRSKFIDRLLIDCLGWQEPDIRRELSKCKRRLDYHLSTTKPCVVVEAKRAKERILALTGESRYRVRINKLLKSQPSMKEHLDQLAGYCHSFSIPFGILTNGRILVALCCNRTDSIPWIDGYAVVFPDILSDNFDFDILFNLFSRTAVALGSLQREFLGIERSPIPPTVLSILPDSEAPAPPNPLVEALNPVLQAAFKDVLSDEDDELVSECYVRPGESRLRDDSVEGPLIDRPPTISQTVVDIHSRSTFERFEAGILERLRKRGQGSTIIVIGNVGVGKTMFRRFFFSPTREGRAEVANVVPFIVDFRKGMPPIDGVHKWILSELRTTLDIVDDDDRSNDGGELPHIPLSGQNTLNQIFRIECKQFDRVHADVHERDKTEFSKLRAELLRNRLSDDSKYVPHALKYIATTTKYMPCVVLDNADHHSAEFQTQAYLAAKALEQQLGCLIMLMLQEAWYWHFKLKDSPLSSYHDTVFHIPAPRMRDVLSKRLDFAVKRADHLFPKGLVVDLGSNMALQPTHVSKYLTACKQAFFHDDEITTCYECLSSNDVRRGLELFCTFVRAGHQAAQTALSAIVAGETLRFSLDEVICAMACGEFRHYRARRSLVPNIFTQLLTENDLTYSRLGAYYLLSCLAKRKNEHSSAGSGYVRRDEVIDMLGTMGVPEEAPEAFLESLCESRLVQPSQAMPKDVHQAPFFRASALGLYVVDKLVTTAGYLSCVAMDTPIRDATLRRKMYDAAQVADRERFAKLHLLARDFHTELKAVEDDEYARVCETQAVTLIDRLTEQT